MTAHEWKIAGDRAWKCVLCGSLVPGISPPKLSSGREIVHVSHSLHSPHVILIDVPDCDLTRIGEVMEM